MKHKEIVTLLILFGSVFVMVGILRYLDLYEGLEAAPEDEEPFESRMYEGMEHDVHEGLDAPTVTPPANPPSPPVVTPASSTSVTKYATF